jgi:hypothetical protein
MPFGTQLQVPGPPLAPLHVLGAVQAGPQTMVPPQPSDTEPQLFTPQACAIVSGTHMQTFGVEVGHWSGAVQVPQVTGVPQLFVVVPQLFAIPLVVPQACAFDSGAQPHVPGPPVVLLHVWVPVQLPQLTVPPQPSGAFPQLALPHCADAGSGIHPQVPGPPLVLLHTFGNRQVPQLTELPQLSTTEPQLSPPQAAAVVSGMQAQVPGLPLHCCCAPVQLPQLTMPPQPSGAVPQLLVPQAWAAVCGVQPQTFGLLWVPPPQVCGAVHPGTQVMEGQPLPGVNVPQLSPAGHVVWQVVTHWPELVHIWPAPLHMPQVTRPPQPSGAVPHTAVPQACAAVSGVQMLQVPGLALHENCVGQLPQLTTAPQPSGALPHVMLPQAAAWVSGMQTQAPGLPVHVCGAVQLPQLTVPPHPLGAEPQVLLPQAWAAV